MPSGGGTTTMRGMTLEELLRDAPQLNVAAGGEPTAWPLAREVLAYIDGALDESSHTLETGIGLSTVLFAVKRCRHTCVAPFADEVERVRSYCRRRGLELDRVRFVVEESQRALPRLDAEALDLVLIDGNHAFPAPFIDWYYTAARLRRGGMLVVDDTQLWTGRVLREFLVEDPGWRLAEAYGTRAARFEKLFEGLPPTEWNEQPFVLRRSAGGGDLARLRKGVAYLGRGQVGTFARKAAAEVSRRLARRRG